MARSASSWKDSASLEAVKQAFEIIQLNLWPILLRATAADFVKQLLRAPLYGFFLQELFGSAQIALGSLRPAQRVAGRILICAAHSFAAIAFALALLARHFFAQLLHAFAQSVHGIGLAIQSAGQIIIAQRIFGLLHGAARPVQSFARSATIQPLLLLT